jgi:L-ascorbate metabolism protein UlaG (beta-lactamase superfamily)
LQRLSRYIRSNMRAILTLMFALSACSSQSRVKHSDHFDGKKFFHPWGEDAKSFLTLLKWQLTSDKIAWPKSVENLHKPNFKLAQKSDQIAVTFINHATVYLQHEGLGILTDPVWSKRTSPVSFAGPQRVREPGAAIDGLPRLDYVVVSHNHYDHLDIDSLVQLDKLYKPLFLVPIGDGDLLKKYGIQNFVEMDWWDEHIIDQNKKIVFVPVKHWSARGLWDRNKSLWGGYVIVTANKKIFFSGDTGYCDTFKSLSKKYGAFDFSLLPIGAYEPRWFMKDAHMNPEEAVQAHLDLQSKKTMGIHFGTWQLTDEGMQDPEKDLQISIEKNKVAKDSFFTLGAGESRIVD